MAASDLLTVENLSVAFAGGAVKAVNDVSFEIRPGEAFGLVGESGSGKSVTSLAILGLVPETATVAGRITYGRTSLLELSESEMRKLRGSRIAMIFQDPTTSLNPVSRVGDSVAQVIRAHSKVGRATSRRRAIDIMDRVGIQNAALRARAYPHEFSGGMRQRILIAMALAAKPTILLADEPTTALDVVVQAGILQLLDRLRREDGMSVLLVSHDLGIVAGFCERVGVMYAGQLVEVGPTAEVLFKPRMPYTIGLIRSVPDADSGRGLESIVGSPPDPAALPQGCSFHPRCRIVASECETGTIPLTLVNEEHWSRCIRIDQIRELVRRLDGTVNSDRRLGRPPNG